MNTNRHEKETADSRRFTLIHTARPSAGTTDGFNHEAIQVGSGLEIVVSVEYGRGEEASLETAGLSP